jgi:hypothetical protein
LIVVFGVDIPVIQFQLDPPSVEYSSCQPVMLPFTDAVILCAVPTCQFSPPFGDVTVTVGIGCEIVKYALLASATLPLAYNTVALTLQVVEGALGTVHETLIVVFGVDIPVIQFQLDPPSVEYSSCQPVMLPFTDAVMLCELPTCQFSPPLGDVTVTVGGGLIVKLHTTGGPSD